MINKFRNKRKIKNNKKQNKINNKNKKILIIKNKQKIKKK